MIFTKIDKYAFGVLLLIGAALAALGGAYIADKYGASYSILPVCLSLVVIALGLVPLFTGKEVPESKKVFVPFLVLWGMATLMEYGYRTLYFGDFYMYGKLHLSDGAALRISSYVIAGIVSCYVGFYVFTSKVKPLDKLKEKIDLSWDCVRVKKLCMYLGAIGILAYAAETIGSAFVYSFDLMMPLAVQQPIHLIGGLPIIAIVVLYIFQLRGYLSLKEKCFLWGALIVPRLVLGIMTGLTGNALIVLFPLIFTYMTIRKRIPFAILAGFLLLFIFGQLVVKRTNMLSDRNFGSTERYSLKSNSEDLLMTSSRLVDRLGAHGVLAHAVRNIPEKAPYYKIEPLKNLFTVFIPRAIWKDKPFPVALDELGGRILTGVEGHKTNGTTLRPTQLGMLYVTWGLPAIIIGMFCFGCIYGFIRKITEVELTFEGDEETIENDRTDYGKLLLGIILASHLIDVEGDCFQVLARAVWPAVMTISICLLFRWNDRRARRALEG